MASGTALECGASGAILAIANAIPYACVTVWEAFRTRQQEAGADWQARILTPSKLVAAKYGIPGLKHAMDLNGYYGGPPRLPLTPSFARGKAGVSSRRLTGSGVNCRELGANSGKARVEFRQFAQVRASLTGGNQADQDRELLLQFLAEKREDHSVTDAWAARDVFVSEYNRWHAEAHGSALVFK